MKSDPLNHRFLLLYTSLQALILSSIVSFTCSYEMNGFHVRDLYETGAAFDTQASTWFINSPSGAVPSPYTTVCNGEKLLSGYNVLNNNVGYHFVQYTNVPAHDIVYFKIKLVMLDSWEMVDRVEVALNAVTLTIPQIGANSGTWPSDICGAADNDYGEMYIFGKIVESTAPFSILQVRNKADEPTTAESFGFREIELLYGTAQPGDVQEICAYSPSLTNPTNACSCPIGQYWDGAACSACDVACEACFGSSASQCYSCSDGYNWDGSDCVECDATCNQCIAAGPNGCYDCANPAHYLHWDGSCQATCDAPYIDAFPDCNYPCGAGQYLHYNDSCENSCDAPLTSATLYGEDFCLYPCTTGEYLYWDGSCEATCDPPLVSVTVSGENFCQYPCTAPEFLYWDGSCDVASCDDPYTSTTYKGQTFCEFGCPTGEYLYDDQTCDPSCPAPWIDAGLYKTEKRCESPCLPAQYFYWDLVCRANCDPPLSSSLEAGNNFCNFPCTGGDYMYWDGSCETSCDDPFTQNTLYGENICEFGCTTGDYLYDNSSCAATCDSGLVSEAIKGENRCTTSCSGSEHFYWDDSCQSSCNTPLIHTVVGGKNYCAFPCADSEYLNDDDSCSSSCDSPLVVANLHGQSLCTEPCSDGEFLYWNGSCLNNCNAPLVTKTVDSTERCTYPCDSNEILQEDGSCTNECASPLELQTDSDGNQYCINPCDEDEILFPDGFCGTGCNSPMELQGSLCVAPCIVGEEFLDTGDDSCVDTCLPPNKIETTKYVELCVPQDYVLSDEEKEKINTAVTSNEITGGIVSAGVAVSAIVSSGEPGGLAVMALVKMLHYIRYMKVSYPDNLLYLFKNQAKNPIAIPIGPDIPDDVKEEFVKDPLPDQFSEYNLHSSFFVNYWKTMTSLAIVIAVGYFFHFFEYLFDKFNKKGPKYVFERLKIITKWNFCLLLFCSNYDEIALFSSLELRTIAIRSAYSTVSTVICVVFLLLSTLVLIGNFLLIKSSRKVLTQVNCFTKAERFRKIAFNKKWESVQVLFKGFKDSSFIQQAFLFFFVLRLALFNYMVAYMFAYPLAQSIIITIMSFMMLVYLILKKPFKKTVNLLQLITYEVIILVVNVLVLIMAIWDKQGIENTEMRENFGYVIILGNVVFMLAAIGFLIAKFVLGVKMAYKITKRNKVKGRKIWLQLLVLPFQQGGMGFEEVDIEEQHLQRRRNPSDKIQKNSVVPYSSVIRINGLNPLYKTDELLQLDPNQDSKMGSPHGSTVLKSSGEPLSRRNINGQHKGDLTFSNMFGGNSENLESYHEKKRKQFDGLTPKSSMFDNNLLSPQNDTQALFKNISHDFDTLKSGRQDEPRRIDLDDFQTPMQTEQDRMDGPSKSSSPHRGASPFNGAQFPTDDYVKEDIEKANAQKGRKNPAKSKGTIALESQPQSLNELGDMSSGPRSMNDFSMNGSTPGSYKDVIVKRHTFRSLVDQNFADGLNGTMKIKDGKAESDEIGEADEKEEDSPALPKRIKKTHYPKSSLALNQVEK